MFPVVKKQTLFSFPKKLEIVTYMMSEIPNFFEFYTNDVSSMTAQLKVFQYCTKLMSK